MVTLPVALAFGVASGLGAAAGLYGAIAVGFFAALFGGTRAQLSAPTAPTTVAMAGALQPAIILALLGSVNSLLPSLVAGFMGGLPGAGATMGTAINIRAGALTRASGAFSAVVLLVFLLGLGQYVEPIPRAVLAGLLIKVGWDIVDWNLLARIHRIRREHMAVMLLTLGLTVFVDLVTGIAIGLIAAGMTHARQLERLEMDSVVSVPLLDQSFFVLPKGPSGSDPYLARVGLLALKGSFTVASSNRLARAISADIKDYDVVIFDFSQATYFDDSAAMVIKKLMDIAREEQTGLIVMGLSGSVAKTLQALAVLREVPEKQVVSTLDEARQAAKDLLGG